MNALTIKETFILQEVLNEVERARAKHPNFADGYTDQALVIAEESGEIARAALLWKYEDGEEKNIIKETIQTMCTCLRLLDGIDFDKLHDMIYPGAAKSELGNVSRPHKLNDNLTNY